MSPLRGGVLAALCVLSPSVPFEWHGAPGKTLTILGVLGDIRVKAAPGKEASVVGRKTSRCGDPESVEIHQITSRDGVTVCTVEAGLEGCSTRGRQENVNVAFDVALPRGVNLVTDSVNGNVTAEGLDSQVSARSVNGSVRVTTSGGAEITTVNGNIHAALGVLPEGSTSFRTVNGSIDLELPASAGGTFSARSMNGDLSSDFPVTTVRGHGHRSLEGTLGPGSATLTLRTVNGRITLHRAR